jgi:hypothetical protein
MRCIVLTAVAAFVCGGAAFSDVVKLKKGDQIDCRIIGYQKQKLVVLVDGQQKSIPMLSVDSFSVVAPSKPEIPAEDRLSLSVSKVGQEGFLSATLKVVSSEEDRFIGSAGSQYVLIQGIDATSLVTDRWVKLTQRLKVVGTEVLNTGRTVFVMEPVQPEQKDVSAAENPALSQPYQGPLHVQDIRTVP